MLSNLGCEILRGNRGGLKRERQPMPRVDRDLAPADTAIRCLPEFSLSDEPTELALAVAAPLTGLRQSQ
ncbi:MAG: hypothetical protein ABIQ49_15280 [Gemmatimonadales bacterium]